MIANSIGTEEFDLQIRGKFCLNFHQIDIRNNNDRNVFSVIIFIFKVLGNIVKMVKHLKITLSIYNLDLAPVVAALKVRIKIKLFFLKRKSGNYYIYIYTYRTRYYCRTRVVGLSVWQPVYRNCTALYLIETRKPAIKKNEIVFFIYIGVCTK